jgi:hypothetical protein
MRRLISSKSNTYTEPLLVNAAGISVKVGAHYPGRPDRLPPGLFPSRGGKMDSQESAEAIVASPTGREGPNPEERRVSRTFKRPKEHRHGGIARIRGRDRRARRIGTESRRQAHGWRAR